MFYAELVAPFFVFGPRVLRRVGFVSMVLLQLLIMATGNYGFFNLLAIVLCLSVLDDRDLEDRREARASQGRGVPRRARTAPSRIADVDGRCRAASSWGSRGVSWWR